MEGPVFFNKEQMLVNDQLENLKFLLTHVIDSDKDKVKKEIDILSSGLLGEKNINYELSHSFLDITYLYNLNLSYQENRAQIDYLIISKSFIVCLECKKYTGIIKINQDGEFTRVSSLDKKQKLGLYSPFEQNNKHLEVLKRILQDYGINIPIIPLIVIADSSAVIKDNKAPNKIKKAVIKYDQLNRTLNKYLEKYQPILSQDEVLNLANFLSNENIVYSLDYVKKLNLTLIKDVADKNHFQEDLYDQLVKMREVISQETQLSPFQILSNKTLMELSTIKPTTLSQLENIYGIGDKKLNDYGYLIIDYIKKYLESVK